MKFSQRTPVKIIVLGAGGTGGYVIPHLYRIAHATGRRIRVIVCDGDVVEQKNLIRQNFVYQDIGKNKAQVLAERYSAAFGITCEYIPGFIESENELLELTKPKYWTNTGCEQVILIGCVDNNKSRRMCDSVFKKRHELVYIDSGNGERTGQVVCGIRRNNKTLCKPVGSLYPDVLRDNDKFPSELSCAERAVSSPQSVTANITAATAVVSFLYDIIVCGRLYTRYVTFSSEQISMRAVITPKSKFYKTKPAYAEVRKE